MAKSPNALELLRKDHRNVLTLLRRFERASDEREQRSLCDEIVSELRMHTSIEEDCFYPFVREASAREDLIEEATIEHDAVKQLMDELSDRDVEAQRFHALMSVLNEYVGLHVREEEERIFPVVEKMGVDLEALGQELAERKAEGNGGTEKASGRSRSAHTKGHGRGGESEQEDESSNEPAEDEESAGEGRSTAAKSRASDRDEEESTSYGDSTDEDEAYLSEHGEDLSRSTQHAKWIHSVDEHEDHPGQTLVTRNPDVIRSWAEERGAVPATTPGGDPDEPRVLRFDFPGYDRQLQELSWDAWLRVFEERELVFLFQEHMKAGNQSNFFRLDSPHREDG
jgi:hypothetical protein